MTHIFNFAFSVFRVFGSKVVSAFASVHASLLRDTERSSLRLRQRLALSEVTTHE